jgi:hypothetical protein
MLASPREGLNEPHACIVRLKRTPHLLFQVASAARMAALASQLQGAARAEQVDRTAPFSVLTAAVLRQSETMIEHLGQ